MPERSPVHDLATKQGAVLVEEAGWLMPAHYGDAAAEYRHTREQASLFDRSHHGKIELTGKDARTFLHNLSTNEIVRLPIGGGCEAFLTTGQAKIVGHAYVDAYQLPDGSAALWLDLAPGMNAGILKHLDRYLISEQVELADRTAVFAELHLAGPQARAVLSRAVGDVPELQHLHHAETKLNDAVCRIRRHDALGLPGYDLVCPAPDAEALWQALSAAGARPAGLQAYDTLRIEAGTPVYGIDIDDTNLPQEVGRDDQAISFAKGCYIGQETVARIRTYGHVNRLLVGLKLARNEPAPRGSKLYRDGKEVGQTTSSVFSPRAGTAVALGYVRRGNHEPGTALEVETEAGRRTAEVISLPPGHAAEPG